MRLNPLLMEKLAGAEEYAAGRDLEEIGAVKTAEEDKGMIRYTVTDQGLHSVTLTRRLVIHCDCDVFLHKGCCRHAVAVWLYADRRKVPESMMKKQAPETAAELISKRSSTPASLTSFLRIYSPIGLRQILPWHT